MIRVFDNDNGRELGTISDTELQFLIDELEEESAADQDYYIDTATLDMLEEHGAEPGLLALLRHAIEGRESVEIRWQRE